MVRTIVLSMWVATISAVVGCVAIDGGPYEGKVVDAVTGNPILGAFVIAQTVGGGADMVGSRSACGSLNVQQVDAEGRYRVSRGFVGPAGFRYVSVYAQGYESSDPGSDGFRLKAFAGTDDERAADLDQWWPLLQCGDFSDVEPKLRPLYRALDREHRDLRPKRLVQKVGFEQRLDSLKVMRSREGAAQSRAK